MKKLNRSRLISAAAAAVGGFYTRPEVAGAQGTITFLSPAEGAHVSGTVLVQASYSGKGFQHGDLFVDGVQIATTTTNPMRFSWDTTKTTAGSHTLRLDVYAREKGKTVRSSVMRPVVVDVSQAGIYWGARIDGSTYDDGTYVDAPFTNGTPNAAWDLFESHTGKAVTCVSWGNAGAINSPTWNTGASSNARSRGAFSLYTLGPSALNMDDLIANTNVNGTMTAIDTFFNAVGAQGHPMLLRPMWEMNGNFGYNWQTGAGVTAAEYVTAWQNLYNRVQGTSGAACVSFFWCPNQIGGSSVEPITPWYPGDAYVDWIGFDTYSKGSPTGHPPSVATTYDHIYNLVCAIHPTKPLAVGETACWDTNTTTDKPDWITSFLAALPTNYPRIKLFSWFNWNLGTDIASGTEPNPLECTSPTVMGGLAATPSTQAFAAGISSSYYKANVAGSFATGQKVPVP